MENNPDIKPSSCPGASCRYYHVQDNYTKFDRERDEWGTPFTAYFCKHPGLQAGRTGQPRKNRQVPGGSPIGLVCHICKGKFYQGKEK